MSYFQTCAESADWTSTVRAKRTNAQQQVSYCIHAYMNTVIECQMLTCHTCVMYEAICFHLPVFFSFSLSPILYRSVLFSVWGCLFVPTVSWGVWMSWICGITAMLTTDMTPPPWLVSMWKTNPKRKASAMLGFHHYVFCPPGVSCVRASMCVCLCVCVCVWLTLHHKFLEDLLESL